MKFSLLFILAALHSIALAFPENGMLKELNETPVRDDVSSEAKAAPGSAHAAPQASTSLSAYGQLDPFDEMAILQRKFLPRQNRFELGLAYGMLADNAFFDMQATYARLGYSFIESLGVEVLGFWASTSKSGVSKNLLKNGGVESTVSAVPRSYLGADLRWSPIYGKLAFWNSSIVPVEQFFLLGGGRTEQYGAKTATALHIGTGFSFGVLKWLAVRPGIDVFSYSTSNGSHFTDTHLSLGVSTFFPGAQYR